MTDDAGGSACGGTVSVAKVWHWRGGDRWRAQCSCGYRWRTHRSRDAAVIDARAHVALRGASYEKGADDV